MLTLTIILSLIFIAHSYMNDTSYTAYPKTFLESDMLNDGSAFGLPSEHALCGISLTQMKFLKLQYNCNCRKSCQCNGMFICNWCYNTLYTKSNVATAFFCKFNKWSSQMGKSFRTGNKQSRNERIIICPQNHYVTQVSPRINNEQGFNGIKIKCETLNFNSTVMVEDDYSTPLMEPSTYQNQFVTGLQFQYQFNSNLEGVKVYFQQPHRVTRVNFNYSQNSTQYGQVERKMIESVEHSNLNFVPLQKSLSFMNPFQYEEVWKNDKSFQGHRISQDVVANHVGKLKGNQKSIYYNQTSERFKFGEAVKTKVIPVKAINAIIPSCYKVIAKSYIDQQNVTMPYSVEISLKNLQTDSIITANATGKFIGYKTSYVGTEITFEKIQNCSQL